jgi:tagaturonate reductase
MFESLSINNIKPASKLSLPERIIQLGNGVLLRGLPDFYIQKANEKGIFNGKIVVVKSTDQGSERSFKKQDYLFTHEEYSQDEIENIFQKRLNILV